MFQKDHIPILIDLPNTFDYADIYFIHDVHYGSPLFDNKKWEELKKQIIENDKAYVCWVGDLMENAIPNSKSDMFTQKHSPSEQKEWVIQQFKDLADKTLAVVPGNHEKNRTTKVSGLYPLYDCCLIAGIDDKYRNTIAFLDIGIGTFKGKKNKQVHYFGQIQHKAKDLKNYHSSDYTDGIDFFASGQTTKRKTNQEQKWCLINKTKLFTKETLSA